MKIDSFELRGKKTVPKTAHTIITFNLPYAIPIPDGRYRVKIGRHVSIIAVKRIQKTLEGIAGTGNIQMPFDKYGKSSFSSIQMELPFVLNPLEKGRQLLLLGDIPPRSKSKEIALRFLNRLIEAVRYITEEYWVEPARYQDILAYQIFYWDGKKRYPAAQILLDTGVGGVRLGGGHPFQLEPEKMRELISILEKEKKLETSKLFLLNSKDACLQEDFRLAIVESVTALETVLYRFIRMQGEKLEIPKDEVDHFIVDVGLTGNLKVVLKMLTDGLEQVDAEILSKCKGAIKIRNNILHEGFMKVSSTDTEEQVNAIEKMIDYLNRLVATVR